MTDRLTFRLKLTPDKAVMLIPDDVELREVTGPDGQTHIITVPADVAKQWLGLLGDAVLFDLPSLP